MLSEAIPTKRRRRDAIFCKECDPRAGVRRADMCPRCRDHVHSLDRKRYEADALRRASEPKRRRRNAVFCEGCEPNKGVLRSNMCEVCRERLRQNERRRYRASSKRLVKGEVIRCQDCSAEIPRASGNQVRCAGCRPAYNSALKRKIADAKLRAKGHVLVGEMETCRSCGGGFLKPSPKRLYCDPCRDSNAGNKLNARARRRTDPEFLLRCRIRGAMQKALRTGKAWRKTGDLLGYTLRELKLHIERQFVKGMSWDNVGLWHIDHIVPLKCFKITGPDDTELRAAFALTNLRPLWAKENVRKQATRTHLC